MDEGIEQRDGSALCLGCGMCCRGLLHGRGDLQPGERASAEASGLDVVESENGPTFRLPCPRFDGTACEIYAHRPAACQGYRCRLLNDYLEGAVALDDALATVARARQQEDSIRLLSGNLAFPELRRRWRQGLAAFAVEESGSADDVPRLFLLMSAFCAFLDRYFVLAREGGLTLGSRPLEKTGDDE